MNIAATRLQNQRISLANFSSPKEVVSWMGAMQAQDYPGALWSIALRSKNLTRRDIEQAIYDRKIVRTWPMRGTLHFVAAEDAKWMVKLLAPRATAAAASRRRNLGLDDETLLKSKEIIGQALHGVCLTRIELLAEMERLGVATANQRGSHILRYFAEQAFICFGPHQGKQPTFALMDEWLPNTPDLTRDEALARLAKRYFTSHGPATLRDFIGWANLTVNDGKKAIQLSKSEIQEKTIDGQAYWLGAGNDISPPQSSAYLLPGFDEYILGYKDRSAVLGQLDAQKIVPGGNGMFLPTIVVNEKVVGTWKKSVTTSTVHIQLLPFTSLATITIQDIGKAVARYGNFLGLPAMLR